MTTVVSIQARMGSTRLPGKVLLPIGGEPVLGWGVSRCKKADRPDSVVVAAGDAPPDEAITKYCEREGYEYVVGPEENLLERHLSTANATDADTLVRITGDSPFIPPAEIDRIVAAHESAGVDYTTNAGEHTPRGIVIDVVGVDVLRSLAESDETHPVSPLRDPDTTYQTQTSTDPAWEQVADAHLEVNTPAEYFAVADAFNAVGANAQAIADWLVEHR